MNAIIEVGRRVHYRGDICNPSGEGVIVAVHGKPGERPINHINNGVGLIVRQGDCYFDAILFDGRKLLHMHEGSLGGIAPRIALMDKRHGEAIIAMAHRLAEEKIARDKAKAEKEMADFLAAEAARKIEKAPIFYYNGIRDEKGAKLQKAGYGKADLARYPADTITIYANGYRDFSPLVHACFEVENKSDAMIDYFEKDMIRVVPQHPLYPQVLAAFEKQQAASAAKAQRRGRK